MKTVFNRTLIGWTNFHENQLLRCKTHKTFEANIVLNMPRYTSFVDAVVRPGGAILRPVAWGDGQNHPPEPNRGRVYVVPSGGLKIWSFLFLL